MPGNAFERDPFEPIAETGVAGHRHAQFQRVHGFDHSAKFGTLKRVAPGKAFRLRRTSPWPGRGTAPGQQAFRAAMRVPVRNEVRRHAMAPAFDRHGSIDHVFFHGPKAAGAGVGDFISSP